MPVVYTIHPSLQAPELGNPTAPRLRCRLARHLLDLGQIEAAKKVAPEA